LGRGQYQHNEREHAAKDRRQCRSADGKASAAAAQAEAAIAEAEAALAAQGRLLIRKSGTEPLIRVMGESEDAQVLAQAVDSVVTAVEKAVAD